MGRESASVGSVPNAEERQGCLAVVQTIYIGTLVAPPEKR
jgi:hypothetical protein